ncbi:hypothetical protein B9T31_02885 [Acinetobacter sp. ANC 4558]|uniref:TonB-dependent receptor plug domain-containing protein n=1 Tax=Acinetobacter sp. ANC 4558 TaxID=1977876 RepID=UPI000A32E12E|nr:TonB-dependent receptor [Acinetobacter sp. ANC 4558]OTG87465.1 hypothetical protein B9T31_02885 [Acinetobacter sp. ANC 4558]
MKTEYLFNKSTLSVAIILALAHSSQSLYAAETVPQESEAKLLQEVVVLGTKRNNVKALESLAPVEIISSKTLEQTGALTLNQALNQLIPSFNFPQGQNASKGTGAVRSASLRGLSPAYTLILVDGKRRNLSGKLVNGADPFPADQFVEINTIPISAIDRVEVLKDGASAQYGSDAIAGVINIVLKKKDHGGELSYRYGEYKKGDGETNTANGWAGIALPNDGFVTFSGEWLDGNPTDRSGPDLQYVNAGPKGDLRKGQWGQGGRDHHTFLINSELPINDAFTAYGNVNYSDIKNYNFVNPNYSKSKDNILDFYPNGFQPRTHEKRTDQSAVAGLRYTDETLGNFDTYITWGKSNVINNLSNSLSPSYGLKSHTAFYLGETKSDSTNFAIDWNKPISFSWAPKEWVVSSGINYRHEKYATTHAGEEQSWNFGGSNIPNGQLNAGQPARFGSVDIGGINPEDLGSISRDVYSLYAGLEGSVTDKLELGFALRAEDYSDFGNTINGKISTRYEFTPTFATRGTFSTGYRAPSLAQLGQQRTTYTGTWSFDGGAAAAGRTRLFRPNDAAVAAFGAKDLDPAKSQNISLGFVWQPIQNASLTVDAYHIKIKDNIVQTSTLQDPANGTTNVHDILSQAGYSNYTGASFFVNGYDTKTKGVDLVGKYLLNFDQYGKLNLGLGLSFLDTTVSNVKEGNVLTRTGKTLFNRDVILNVEDAIPKNKLNLSANYQIQQWNIALNLTRYGSYVFHHSTLAERDQKFDPQWVLDLDLQYAVNKSLTLNIGANNLFNTYPEEYESYNQVNGINRYGFIHPAGASGAFYYAGFNYKF